ncbi:hypothetical protein [Sorangium sp. So ce1097]
MAVALLDPRRLLVKKILSLQKLSTHKRIGTSADISILSLLLCVDF